jgi:hypothetical protein
MADHLLLCLFLQFIMSAVVIPVRISLDRWRRKGGCRRHVECDFEEWCYLFLAASPVVGVEEPLAIT